LPYCEKCGARVSEDQRSCPDCGAPIKGGFQRRRGDRRVRREDELCFRRESDRDPLGILEFGLFLLVVGVVFITNPDIPSEVIDWVRLMADLETPIRPTRTILSSATMFFILTGLSNLFTAGVRLLIDKVWRRILQDVLSGAGILAFAYLVSLYAKEALTWTNVLAIGAVVLGALMVLYFLFRKIS
jgi:hypothetical protein